MLRVVQRFAREVRKATSLRIYDVREVLVLWDFRRPDTLREWSCISDKDIGGYSSVSLEPNGKGTDTIHAERVDCIISYVAAGTGAKFHGYLNTERPPGMSPRYSGYGAIRSKQKKVNFQATTCTTANY